MTLILYIVCRSDSKNALHELLFGKINDFGVGSESRIGKPTDNEVILISISHGSQGSRMNTISVGFAVNQLVIEIPVLILITETSPAPADPYAAPVRLSHTDHGLPAYIRGWDSPRSRCV